MIPLIKPDLSYPEVAADIEAIISSGQLTRGVHVREFEHMIAAYVGTKHAFTTTSATTALHLSLKERITSIRQISCKMKRCCMNTNSAKEWLAKTWHYVGSGKILYNANHHTDTIAVVIEEVKK